MTGADILVMRSTATTLRNYAALWSRMERRNPLATLTTSQIMSDMADEADHICDQILLASAQAARRQGRFRLAALVTGLTIAAIAFALAAV